MEQKLKDILQNLIVDQDDPDFEKMESDIREQMPGYEIELCDMDDFDSMVDASWCTAEAIGRHVKDGIEDIICNCWYSDDEELAVLVVAIKTKGDK